MHASLCAICVICHTPQSMWGHRTGKLWCMFPRCAPVPLTQGSSECSFGEREPVLFMSVSDLHWSRSHCVPCSVFDWDYWANGERQDNYCIADVPISCVLWCLLRWQSYVYLLLTVGLASATDKRRALYRFCCVRVSLYSVGSSGQTVYQRYLEIRMSHGRWCYVSAAWILPLALGFVLLLCSQLRPRHACVQATSGDARGRRYGYVQVFPWVSRNHLEERLLDQAQARASYTPLFWGHSRSIPQGMIFDVQPLVKSLFCPIRPSLNGFFDSEASIP